MKGCFILSLACQNTPFRNCLRFALVSNFSFIFLQHLHFFFPLVRGWEGWGKSYLSNVWLYELFSPTLFSYAIGISCQISDEIVLNIRQGWKLFDGGYIEADAAPEPLSPLWLGPSLLFCSTKCPPHTIHLFFTKVNDFWPFQDDQLSQKTMSVDKVHRCIF